MSSVSFDDWLYEDVGVPVSSSTPEEPLLFSPPSVPTVRAADSEPTQGEANACASFCLHPPRRLLARKTTNLALSR